MNQAQQVILAICPLLATPLLGFSLAEGIINLGGGEKDILWAFVWGIWSGLFAIAAFVLICRKWPVDRWALRATIIATFGVLVLWLLAFAASMFS